MGRLENKVKKVTEVTKVKKVVIYRKAAYENLKFYQDICEIRRLIHGITERFNKTNLRLISQMRDAARSAKQNIREGYRRGTVGEFTHYIRISQGSLEELSGDMEDCFEDGLISEKEFSVFSCLFRSATYLSTKYITSLYELDKQGKWRSPGK